MSSPMRASITHKHKERLADMHTGGGGGGGRDPIAPFVMYGINHKDLFEEVIRSYCMDFLK